MDKAIRATRSTQVIIMIIGLLGATVMIGLGVWQWRAAQQAGADTIQARIAEPVRELTDVAKPGQLVADGFGRTVTTLGRYRPDLQLLIAPDTKQPRWRVVTPAELPGGALVAVIRGSVADPAQVPPPPRGTVRVTGVLLASELSTPGPHPSGQLGSVDLAAAAQQWAAPMIPGSITLTSAEPGLQAAMPALPAGDGALRNAMYGLQWWIFAAFALGMAAKMAHEVGKRRAAEVDQAWQNAVTKIGSGSK